jgi:hypothetical protein
MNQINRNPSAGGAGVRKFVYSINANTANISLSRCDIQVFRASPKNCASSTLAAGSSKIVRLDRLFRPRIEIEHRQANPTEDWFFYFRYIGGKGRHLIGRCRDVGRSAGSWLAHRFDRWGKPAEALGWRADELFGLDPCAPLARYDRMGLIWMVKSERVVDLTATGRRLSGGLMFYRKWQSNLRLLSPQAAERVHMRTAKANRRARP